MVSSMGISEKFCCVLAHAEREAMLGVSKVALSRAGLEGRRGDCLCGGAGAVYKHLWRHSCYRSPGSMPASNTTLASPWPAPP